MMTQQEVKEEVKEREGNPLIKSRIRSLQRGIARRSSGEKLMGLVEWKDEFSVKSPKLMNNINRFSV